MSKRLPINDQVDAITRARGLYENATSPEIVNNLRKNGYEIAPFDAPSLIEFLLARSADMEEAGQGRLARFIRKWVRRYEEHWDDDVDYQYSEEALKAEWEVLRDLAELFEGHPDYYPANWKEMGE